MNYTSIHNLPIFNWYKIHETNDLTYLLKNPKEKHSLNLAELWLEICDEYLTEFGTNEKQLEYIRLMKEATELYAKVANGERDKLTFAMLSDAKIQEIQSTFANYTFKDIYSDVQKMSNRYIDIYKESIYSFVCLINSFKK